MTFISLFPLQIYPPPLLLELWDTTLIWRSLTLFVIVLINHALEAGTLNQESATEWKWLWSMIWDDLKYSVCSERVLTSSPALVCVTVTETRDAKAVWPSILPGPGQSPYSSPPRPHSRFPSSKAASHCVLFLPILSVCHPFPLPFPSIPWFTLSEAPFTPSLDCLSPELFLV